MPGVIETGDQLANCCLEYLKHEDQLGNFCLGWLEHEISEGIVAWSSWNTKSVRKLLPKVAEHEIS